MRIVGNGAWGGDGLRGDETLQLRREVLFADGSEGEFLRLDAAWSGVLLFVGRNGSGKSRAAREVARRLGGRFLATDRLVGLMSFVSYPWGAHIEKYKGVPLSQAEKDRGLDMSLADGLASPELHVLQEQPEVALRLAAFVRRALGRELEIRENSGFLDPYIRVGGCSYSLLRDEGHGLRELIVLLAATYRDDHAVLVIDEPELHLHPSLVRLWMAELRAECARTGKRAVVVTHDPGLVRPQNVEQLSKIYLFRPGHGATRMSDVILPQQTDRIEASLSENPLLVSSLAFAPRPVLVEGPLDVLAMSTAIRRLKPAEVVEQTDFVHCGNSHGVVVWLEVAKKLGVDVRAVMDLDALFAAEIKRVFESSQHAMRVLSEKTLEGGITFSKFIRPLIEAARAETGSRDPKGRSEFFKRPESIADDSVLKRYQLLLDLAKDLGVWIHPQGTLEDVLDVDRKTREAIEQAASQPSCLDAVLHWAGYEMDTSGDLEKLLSVAIMRICHDIQEAQLLNPGAVFCAPVGLNAAADSRLVDVSPGSQAGYHRVTVKTPASHKGWAVEFDANTPNNELLPVRPT